MASGREQAGGGEKAAWSWVFLVWMKKGSGTETNEEKREGETDRAACGRCARVWRKPRTSAADVFEPPGAK